MTGVLFPLRTAPPIPVPAPPAVAVVPAPALTADRLRTAAGDLLSGALTVTGAEAVWSLACVYLLRAALEAELDALWSRTLPELAAACRRAQLLVLPQVIDVDTASAVAELWGALSEGTHLRAYALAPAVSEVTAWGRQLQALINRLPAAGADRPGKKDLSTSVPLRGEA